MTALFVAGVWALVFAVVAMLAAIVWHGHQMTPLDSTADALDDAATASRELAVALRAARGVPEPAAPSRPATEDVALTYSELLRARRTIRYDATPDGVIKLGDTFAVPTWDGVYEQCTAIDEGDWCALAEGHRWPHLAVADGRISRIWTDSESAAAAEGVPW